MNTRSENVIAELAASFHKNGCVRVPNLKRRKRENQGYKKGYEVRLKANSPVELRQLRALLHETGFKPGRPYQKSNGFILPVYGCEAVKGFCEMIHFTPPSSAR